MTNEIKVTISRDTDIITARQIGKDLAGKAGLTGSDLTLIATAISEVARNIISYAKNGEIRISLANKDGKQGIMVVAQDHGPGIPDINQAMRDGYSTGQSLGLGLPGARRLMDEFHIVSELGKGTTVTMHKWCKSNPNHVTTPITPSDDAVSSIKMVEWGIAARAYRGENQSGDKHVIAPFDGGVLVAVIDGLGHGADAADAAQRAVNIMADHPSLAVSQLVQSCHVALHNSRGAVMTVASFDIRNNQLTWTAVGDVEATLYQAATMTHQTIVPRRGVVGYQLPALREVTLPITHGDVLILATDGISNNFTLESPPQTSAQDYANHLLEHYGKDSDDALVLVVRYLGRKL
jgi:phosphoserine phosphatase RsbX